MNKIGFFEKYYKGKNYLLKKMRKEIASGHKKYLKTEGDNLFNFNSIQF